MLVKVQRVFLSIVAIYMGLNVYFSSFLRYFKQLYFDGGFLNDVRRCHYLDWYIGFCPLPEVLVDITLGWSVRWTPYLYDQVISLWPSWSWVFRVRLIQCLMTWRQRSGIVVIKCLWFFYVWFHHEFLGITVLVSWWQTSQRSCFLSHFNHRFILVYCVWQGVHLYGQYV